MSICTGIFFSLDRFGCLVDVFSNSTLFLSLHRGVLVQAAFFCVLVSLHESSSGLLTQHCVNGRMIRSHGCFGTQNSCFFSIWSSESSCLFKWFSFLYGEKIYPRGIFRSFVSVLSLVYDLTPNGQTLAWWVGSLYLREIIFAYELKCAWIWSLSI